MLLSDEEGAPARLKRWLKTQKHIIRSLEATKSKSDVKWVILIVAFALAASLGLSFFSNQALSQVTLGSAFAILMTFILIGIFFDIIGTAVTAADATPFHSMAARKVHGAKYSIKIINGASKVSNFCNDVIGDITGIISGGTVVVIVSHFASTFTWVKNEILWSLIFTSIVAALTIGGKAIGKSIAINYCNTIIFYVGLLAESIVRLVNPKALERSHKKKQKK